MDNWVNQRNALINEITLERPSSSVQVANLAGKNMEVMTNSMAGMERMRKNVSQVEASSYGTRKTMRN